MREPLLRARDVVRHFPVRRGLLQRVVGQVRAVDRVSVDIFPGETLGVVGKSGCGKSTLGRVLAGLLAATSGELSFEGKSMASQRGAELKRLRRDMQFIFQDPTSSLDPRMTVRDIIAEGLDAQGIATGRARERLVHDILDRVGMRQDSSQRYPHEFSGGQRQRIGIARALVLRPKLVVADEPVSALDVSVQSQVLNLLVELKRELQLTYVFVAHNLAVVSYISDRIAVMYLGKIVEIGEAANSIAIPVIPTRRLCCRRCRSRSPAVGRSKSFCAGMFLPRSIRRPGAAFGRAARSRRRAVRRASRRSNARRARRPSTWSPVTSPEDSIRY